MWAFFFVSVAPVLLAVRTCIYFMIDACPLCRPLISGRALQHILYYLLI